MQDNKDFVSNCVLRVKVHMHLKHLIDKIEKKAEDPRCQELINEEDCPHTFKDLLSQKRKK